MTHPELGILSGICGSQGSDDFGGEFFVAPLLAHLSGAHDDFPEQGVGLAAMVIGQAECTNPKLLKR